MRVPIACGQAAGIRSRNIRASRLGDDSASKGEGDPGGLGRAAGRFRKAVSDVKGDPPEPEAAHEHIRKYRTDQEKPVSTINHSQDARSVLRHVTFQIFLT